MMDQSGHTTAAGVIFALLLIGFVIFLFAIHYSPWGKNLQDEHRRRYQQRERAKDAAIRASRIQAIRAREQAPVPPYLPYGRERRPTIPREVKEEVFRRDGGICQRCGDDFDIQYDHVTPFSGGGSSDAWNLQLLCGKCNRKKGARLT